MVFKNLSKNTPNVTSIRKGIIRTKNLNAALDSATVVLTHVLAQDIEPYDIIKLTENGLDEFWLVANTNWSIVKKEKPFFYDYQIDLCELTKLLETITMPSMAITNIGQNRSAWFYINNAIKMYFHADLTNQIDFDNTTGIGQLLNETICPEMTFSQPTLREYIDFFFNIKGYRCYLAYDGTKFILKGIDYNIRKENEFPLNMCDNIVGSQTAADYVTQLSSEISNVVNPETIVEYHKLKSETGYFSEKTASLVLDYKPYDLKKVEILELEPKASVELKSSKTLQHGVAVLEVYSMGLYIYSGSLTIETDDGTRDTNTYLIYNYNDQPGVTFCVRPIGSYVNCKMLISPIVDITENVVTSEIFNGLKTLPKEKYVSYEQFDQTNPVPRHYVTHEKYTNNTLSWSRGSKQINNLFSYQKAQFLWEVDDETAVEYAYLNGIASSINDNAIPLHGNVYYNDLWFPTTDPRFSYKSVGSFTHDGKEYICAIIEAGMEGQVYANIKFNTLRFRVEYQPYLEFKMIQRQPDKNHLIEMNNSTTNAKTDLLSFYQQSKEKNKQLGNESITFYGHSNEDSIAFEVGQTITLNNSLYVLNTLEYTTKNDLILYKGTLSKDFSNQNINTILNRDKRYYALPNTNESVDRHVLFEIPTLYGAFTNPNYRIGVSIYDRNDNFIGSTPVNRVTLESGVTTFSFAFMDNVALNIKQSTEQVSSTKIYKCEYIKYVDDNGETDFLKFILYAKPNHSYDPTEYDYEYDVKQDADQMISSYEFTTPNYFLKDSRERLIITINKL